MSVSTLLPALTAVLAASPLLAAAQPSGITRSNLQEHRLSASGWEAIQTRVDFAPKAVFPAHMHPGDEIIYVLKGALQYRIQGQPPVTLHAGSVLFIPYGKAHGAANVGIGSASELATYVVEEGKPLVRMQK